MQDDLGAVVCRRSLAGRPEAPKVNALVLKDDSRPVLHDRWVVGLEDDTEVAGGIGRAQPPVFHVLLKGDVAQVRNTVVARVPVLVVDDVRPISVDIEPCDTVGQSAAPCYENLHVASALVQTAADRASRDRAVAGHGPATKDPGFRVVIDKLTQLVGGKIRLSHDALQLLIGQRPASVSALRGLRYFALSIYPVQRRQSHADRLATDSP
jgi:hypothetical protein